MDDFFFTEYEDAVPREEVRLKNVEARHDPGTKIIRLFLELTPFIDKPSLDIRLRTGEIELASTSLVELISPKNELAMHIRAAELPEECELNITVYYMDIALPEEGKEIEKPVRQIVDNKSQVIELSN